MAATPVTGATATGLPALGGAGGNAGVFGEHGAVGDFGTLPGGLTQPADPDGSLLSLGTSGSFLTNSDGQVVTLHGLNEVYKIAPGDPLASGFDDDDAAFLAENGFNAVRVGVIWSDLEPEPGVFNTMYLNSIESTVQTLGSHGIYSIIDFHQDAYSTAFGGEGAPDWAVQTDGAANPSLPFPYNEFFNPAEQQAWESFWSNADAPNGIGLENNYSQMLEYVANAFNGNPNVAGFELMNEPSPGISSFLPTLLGSPFFDSQQLTPFYDQGADAIRAVDPSTPIFFEPNVLSNAGIPTDLGHVDATNTVLSFHDYCEFDLGPLGCIPSVSGIVGNAENYAEAQGIPAFMTEFGATSDQAAILAPMQGADQHLIGWTEWAYSSQGDITTSASPPSSESLVYNPADPLTRRQHQHRQPGHARRAVPAAGLRHPGVLLVRQRDVPVQLLHRRGGRPGQLPGRLADHHLGPECRVPGRLPRQRHRRRCRLGHQRRRTGDRLSNGASTVTVTVSAA